MARQSKGPHAILVETRRIWADRKRVEEIAATPDGSNVVLLPLREGWGRIAVNIAKDRRTA